MRTVLVEEWVQIPEGVTVNVKTRQVKVKGPRGEITKSFKHMPVEISIQKQQTKNRKGTYLNIKMWFGGSKQSCSVSTLKSLIRNMISGVITVRRYTSEAGMARSCGLLCSYFSLSTQIFNYN
jgi:large subunit ribosomal protein L9e